MLHDANWGRAVDEKRQPTTAEVVAVAKALISQAERGSFV